MADPLLVHGEAHHYRQRTHEQRHGLRSSHAWLHEGHHKREQLTDPSSTITEVIQTVSVIQIVDSTGSTLAATTLTSSPTSALADGSPAMTTSSAAAVVPTVSSPATSSYSSLSSASSTDIAAAGLNFSSSTTSPTPDPTSISSATSSSSSSSSDSSSASVSSTSSTSLPLASSSSSSTTSSSPVSLTSADISSSTSIISSSLADVTSSSTAESSVAFPTLAPNSNSSISALGYANTSIPSASLSSILNSTASYSGSLTGLTSLPITSGSASRTASAFASLTTSQENSSSTGSSTGPGGSASATATGADGGSGGSSSTTASTSPTTSSASSGGGAGQLTPAQTQMVGGIVGGIAGIAVIALLAFMVLRWKARNSEGRLRLGDDSTSTAMRALTAPPGPYSDAGETVGSSPQRPSSATWSSPRSVAQSLVALTGHRRQSRRQTLETVPESERGFQKISGRKLPSVLQYGGDGYSDPRSMSGSSPSGTNLNTAQQRESDTSEYSVYRDSMAFFNQPNSPKLQLGSPMRPESGIVTMKPSPGRTPVTEEPQPPWDSPTLPSGPSFQPLVPQQQGRSLMTRQTKGQERRNDNQFLDSR